MSEVAYKNTGKFTRHIGGKSVVPGETAMIDIRLVPGFVVPGIESVEAETVEGNTAPVIDEILSHTIPQLREILSGLSIDDLDKLEAGENAKPAPRKGALAAIAEERMNRASAGQGEAGDPQLDAYAALLAEMDDDELAEQDGHGDPSVQAAIDAEREARARAVELEQFKTEYGAFEAADLEELKAAYADQPDYLAAIDELIAAKAGA